MTKNKRFLIVCKISIHHDGVSELNFSFWISFVDDVFTIQR